MASTPITWLNFADEIARSPDLADGYGFAIREADDYSVTIDVYACPFNGERIQEQRCCSLFVKWDGCSHLNMAKDDCFHLCGARTWANDMDLIRRGAFTLAARTVKNFDAELAGWADDRPLAEVPCAKGWWPDSVGDD